MDHQAFAQLLGNYGEFIGAIAVVVTLFYLAVQIRQNTEQSRLNSFQVSTERYAGLITTVLQDPEKFAAFKSALNGFHSSEPQHQGLFHSQVYNTLNAVSHSQALFDAGTISEEPLINQKKDFARILKSPGGKEWMEAFGVDPESPFYKDILSVGADEPPLNQAPFFRPNGH